jgi:hypothetical protein
VSYAAAPVQIPDHELVIGNTYSGSAQLYDESGVVYDITGATGVAQVRTEAGGLLLLSPTVTITGATGLVSWSSTAAATAALSPGPATLGVTVTFADASVLEICWSRVTIRLGYTS